MVLAHPQLSVNDVSINGEDLEGVYVMLYFESWMVLVVIYVSVSGKDKWNIHISKAILAPPDILWTPSPSHI